MNRTARQITTVFLAFFAMCFDSVQADAQLKVLLITGGCCHDYDFQAAAMKKAAEKFNVEIDWTVVNDGGKGTSAEIDLYNDPNWAKGFDVVVHNECFAKTTNVDYIKRITKAHYDGANAVVIHCAMHTYRNAKEHDWHCLLYTSPSPRDQRGSRMPSSA